MLRCYFSRHLISVYTVKITNMKCLTPTSALEGGGDCNFLAANLYAKVGAYRI